MAKQSTAKKESKQASPTPEARPASAKGVYLKKVSVSTTMGAGVRVDQTGFTQQVH